MLSRRGFLQLLGLTAATAAIAPSDLFAFQPDVPLANSTITMDWVCRELANGLASRYGVVDHVSASLIGQDGLLRQTQLSVTPFDQWDGLTVSAARKRFIEPGLAVLERTLGRRDVNRCGELELPIHEQFPIARRVTSMRHGWSVRGLHGIRWNYEIGDWETITRFDILTN